MNLSNIKVLQDLETADPELGTFSGEIGQSEDWCGQGAVVILSGVGKVATCPYKTLRNEFRSFLNSILTANNLDLCNLNKNKKL